MHYAMIQKVFVMMRRKINKIILEKVLSLIIEVECTKCKLEFTTDIHGKDALKFIKKYGTIQNGKIFVSQCACGNDLTLKDPKLVEI